MGLVSRVVPRADLERETLALAAKLASRSPVALALAKEAAATLRYLRELTTLVIRGLLRQARPAVERHVAGLCAECLHARPVTSGRGSTFWLCGRSAQDPAFPKYPRLPVLQCAGFERGEG